jgi:hypothetical protein
MVDFVVYLFQCIWFLNKMVWDYVWFCSLSTSFPGLSYEDEARQEKALVWAGHVTTQKLAVFDSYSWRSGEIFFNEIYKSSKQINSQKTSQSILFMCRAKFGTNQLKSLKTPIFLEIFNHRQSCIQAASRRLLASGDSHEICFLSFWTVWPLLLILSLNMLL